MKKTVLFLFLILSSISYSEFKMNFKDRRDGFNGFPVYTYTTDDYDRDRDLPDLIKKAKELKEKEKVDEITVLLEMEGVYGYIDRVDLQDDKFYIDVESDDDYVQLLVNEDNFIKYKKAGLVK
ncbi:hypothetical protein I6E17_02585 [Fusobacterium perfoetens]|uniref:hypothetical protein n=1 Tax=Fusobacterium perfoetens TaxID=852 RepID=UPI001F2E3029|nr:hypothetical protein [Fusobacterium perfoetens]MCF2625063.1 hypothetical protein [Fusobacterium perfoetens]